MVSTVVGYSGTPLFKKLGYKPGLVVYGFDLPPEYRDWLGPDGGTVAFVNQIQPGTAAGHIFVTSASTMAAQLTELRGQVKPNGFVWVSWPKKASKVSTDIDEQTIRDIALPMGWVDIKVCAVSDVWSGLKLVIRKSER